MTEKQTGMTSYSGSCSTFTSAFRQKNSAVHPELCPISASSCSWENIFLDLICTLSNFD